MIINNKEILKNLFSLKNIIIYVLAFMISIVGMEQDVSPFSIAIVGACFSSGIPAIVVVILGLIGNLIGVGVIGALNYILILLMLLIVLCLRPPKENDEYPYPPEAADYTYDGLHPSDKGNEEIACLLADKIREVMREECP